MEFVTIHRNEDVNALRLRYTGKKTLPKDLDLEFALLQIEARQKSRIKLSTFLLHPEFLFPTLLSAEQSTNESVARFHSSLIKSSSSLLDLTAGLGIDDMTFALHGIDVTACEIDEVKCEVLRHNVDIIGVSDRINIKQGDSIAYLKSLNRKFDVIFADPARRNIAGEKIHALSDCQPDILSVMADIITIAPRLLIKCSPLLDLTFIRNTVEDLNHIYVVCFKGECKEVLIDVKKNSSFEGVTVVDLDREGEISRFHTGFTMPNNRANVICYNKNIPSEYTYLYEPNAGVMKTGAWADLIENYPNLSKADPNTHLFLSDQLYCNFPGRVLKILSEPDKGALKAIKGTKINVVSRNHPLSPQQISKKFSLTSGSDKFLYAFKNKNTPTFLITEIIK